MRRFRADLHIHTCLSPCASLEMSPGNIVKKAKKMGLSIIGICDHNTAENVPAVGLCAKREGITVIGGMEITSREEVHILAWCDGDSRLQSLQAAVYDHLPGENDEEAYGVQVVANERDEVVGFNTRLLAGAVELTVDRIVRLIHEHQGLAVAAHVDRPSFGIIGQLGFIPETLDLDALEIMDRGKRSTVTGVNLPFLASSDAHNLEEIGNRYSEFILREPSFDEIRRSFRGEGGRSVGI